jgi:cyclohexanone monooxygenase
LGTEAQRYDAVVVGAGFAGLYALHRLRGDGLRVRVLEAGSGIGGTWFWNRYPGARCDVESLDYSYSFSEELQQEWSWSERYPAQPELLRYLEHVADRFGLWPDIQLDTRVVAAEFDEEAGEWTVTTEAGEAFTARFCVMATGILSASQVPDIPGLDGFEGEWHHPARWPREGVDFTGKRVGVIGTGSTGIQMIPEIAREAGHTYIFQRTANFSVPNANRPMDPEAEREVKARYAEQREFARRSLLGVAIPPGEESVLAVGEEEARRTFQERWEQGGGMPVLLAYNDLLVDERANAVVADFVRGKIRETVKDPETAELLVPRDFPIGAKRLCQDEGYFETFNRDDVTLVDIRANPITEITPTGLRTAAEEYPLDVIVFATGFDAMTGALLAIDIRGRDGRTLREAWADGPHAYLGLAVAGFPNLFTITGPGSPSALSNVVTSIEQHVDWIADCVGDLAERGSTTIEATPEAQEAWMAHVAEVAQMTLFPRAASWYVGANVPGKPQVFMPYVGGVGPYRERCAAIAAAGYEGFVLGPADAEDPTASPRLQAST